MRRQKAGDAACGQDWRSESWRPDIAVIVPAYNSADTICQCLRSVMAQDCRPFRFKVIVVDNNSTDATEQKIREFPVDLAFENQTQTSYAARNRGLELAGTEIVVFIDSDCIAEENWLRYLVDPFRDPAVGVVGGKIASLPPSSSLVEAFLAQVKKSDGSQFQKTEPMAFPGGNVAYRATALQKVGIFDAAMPGGGDVDLAWRAQAYAGYKGVFAGQAVVYHKHRSSLTGLFRQYRRYGCSEIVLTTLYRNETFHCRTPKSQLRTMARQVRALCTYPVSFLVRLTRWRRWQADRLYLVWPVLRFVLELGSLAGKIEGLVRTRCFRRNPYPTDAKQVKRKPSASPSSDTVGSRARELAA